MSSSKAKEKLVMRAYAGAKTRALLAVLAVTAGLLVLTGSAASAAAVSVNLCALPSSASGVTMPDGVNVPFWGFADGGTGPAPDCSAATATLPGPHLDVNEGDVVTINVTNALPIGTAANPHTVTFEIPGVTFAAGPADAAVGATVTRTFTAGAPGSYLYQSAGDAGRQLAMGLYGSLTVRPATAGVPIAGQAYHPATTAYDVEATLVMSAFDPDFNADPDGFDMKKYVATYWLINGKAYPDTAPIAATAGQRVLLRYLNAGYDNTTMMLLGMHEQVVARDSHLLNNPFAAAAETIPAGGTEDAIATVPASAAPSSNGFALFNRQLHVTNGPPSSPSHTPGGMLTFIKP
ncbi:MAG: multicopper oxidase domain-containing protein [Mycobacteriales bacterium]